MQSSVSPSPTTIDVRELIIGSGPFGPNEVRAIADALGTTEAQASKYAKLFGETMVEGINKIKFFEDEKPILKQVN